MKKTLAVLFVFKICLFCQAQSFQASQTISPREIFIGDTAEISYTFYSPAAFPIDGKDSVPVYFEEKEFITDSYTILGGNLSRSGNQYTLTFSFIPWRTGKIDIPPFDLLTVLDNNYSGFIVDLSPVFVSSITEKTGRRVLQSPAPPILIPGTIYAIYAAGIFFLLVFIVLVWVLFNLQRVAGWFSSLILFFGYMQNARLARRALRRLSKNEKDTDDYVFCETMENILRKYLAYRFDKIFLSLTSDRIEAFFYELFAGDIPLSYSVRIENLETLFRRMDYIRYARGSLDSMRLPVSEYTTTLSEDERKQAAGTAKELVSFFEDPDRQIKQVQKDKKPEKGEATP
ncbi:hypothetical protein HRI96_01940 [Treponema parvum]|uniref:Uncharacterized protein n=1 Tax=Treponema parvum TaxID=138851 RepID=A0A975EYD9_9SPIR|nr:hypothetical protein [Treponema parvum]QTQ11057.1 hypothetical protein HRI96_01940 [Treponema parvum]